MSASWLERKALFQTDDGSAYIATPRIFMGRLYTDLNGVQSGIMPGVEIKIILTPHPLDSKLLIDSFDDEVEKQDYTLSLDSIKGALINLRMLDLKTHQIAVTRGKAELRTYNL